MGKKIIIGTMLVLTLLLLIPPISAIQQKVILDEVDIRGSKLLSKLQDLDIEKIKDLFNKKSLGYFQDFLGLIVIIIYFSRAYRSVFLRDFPGIFGLNHSLIHLRGVWLWITAVIWLKFWQLLFQFDGNPFPT